MELYKNNKGYSVSEDGRVYSMNYRSTGRVAELSPIKHSVGYLRVNVSGKMMGIHRLVAETYIENPEGKREVDHIDGDKTNNDVSNLRWVTHKENIAYAMERLGRWQKGGKGSPVIKLIDGVKESWPSIKEAAESHQKEYRVFAPAICRAIKKGWKAYGGHWIRDEGGAI